MADRSGILNLYEYSIKSGEVTQLTYYEKWDVRWASSDAKRRIVYERNGELHIYNTKNDQDRKLSIQVPQEGLAMRPSYYSAADNIEDFELSPAGNRALFVARGDIFTVPTEQGPTRNLTNSSDSHDKWARWSPDGKKIAFISDQSGDYEIPERPKVTLPGARFQLDKKSNRYRIAKIFRGENSEPKYRSPLSSVGVAVSPGDYVLSISGQKVTGNDNPYRLLRHQTDPVTMMVNSKPNMEGARQVTFRPVFDESSLLYLEWVRGNLDRVDKATDGRVGYLHLSDMGAGGIYEFIKWFYPQIRKQGLIIDVRANGGGNVSQWTIERLDNKLLGTRFGSSSDDPGTYPDVVFHGHMVCVLNQNSASDGDIFPYRFRQAGLGPLIGMRSWGGVVGISGRGPLIDGGQVYVPLSATNAPTGEWIIEGHGVDPDIEVENDPKSVIQGKDPQLQRAIKVVLKRIEKDPKQLPQRPADPVKTD